MTQNLRQRINDAMAPSGGDLGVALTHGACAYLAARIAVDLGHAELVPNDAADLPTLYEQVVLEGYQMPDEAFAEIFGSLVAICPDADVYFTCLAQLHKARLKYHRIMEFQPLPTLDQVGPRGLLQYGSISPASLSGLLIWRKWLFDLDNRSAQETGYLFEPIIANSIGGISCSAARSPVRRAADPTKGRQVDCILEDEKLAYEVKIRVTIAASGQGRWSEETAFPRDCQSSGYTPVLVVLDPTDNPRLAELQSAFVEAHGRCYVGEAAWEHLYEQAGDTMRVFLREYVHHPLSRLVYEAPATLPALTLSAGAAEITMTVGSESIGIRRTDAAAGRGLRADDPS